MLAEVKEEVKKEGAEADLDRPDKQPKTFQERLQSQTVLPLPNATSKNNEIIRTPSQTTRDEERVANFGWEQIENGPLLPFVTREPENFVANHIVGQLVYKNIEKDFSKELLFCMAIMMPTMSQKEADAFNEINIKHCDRSIVGSYRFKAGEHMIELDNVKKIIQYYNACRDLIIHKRLDNNLFGFIEIAGENQVPFIWDEDRKLVPLFYFENPSDYLHSRSKELTDPFKIGYVKFCCKVQKIKKDFYEQNSLKVVDLEDVKKLFPADITFKHQLPKTVNQDLLAPEIRVAFLHGMEERIQTPPNITAPDFPHSNVCEREKDVSSVSLSNREEPSDTITSEGGENEPIQNKTLGTELQKYKEHIRNYSNMVTAKPQQKRPAQSVSEVDAKKRKMGDAEPKNTHQSSTMLHEQSPEVPTTKQIDNPEQATEMGAAKPKNTCQSMTMLHEQTSESQISQLESAVLPLSAVLKTPTTNQIENAQQVPHSQDFPRVPHELTITPIYQGDNNLQHVDNLPVASAPSEFSIVSPVAAPSQTFTRTNQDRGGLTTNVPHNSPRSASSPGYSQPYAFMNGAAQKVPGYSAGTEILGAVSTTVPQPEFNPYQRYFNNNGPQQFGFGNRTHHHPKTQQYINTQHYIGAEQQNCAPYPVRNGPINLPNNTCRPNYYQHPAVPKRYSYNFRPPHQFNAAVPNRMYNGILQGTPQQTFQGGQQQHSYFPYPPGIMSANQNFPGNPVFVPTNIMIPQEHAQNYRPATSATARPTSSFQGQDVNNNTTRNPTTVIEHPGCVNPDPESYKIKSCAVRGKSLLGISMSPIFFEIYLVNLSEFVEKVLGLNPFANHTELSSKFSCLYALNPVQKVQWERVAKDQRLEFVGQFKDVFVNYAEVCAY